MRFKTHYLAMSVAERDQLANDAGTTRGLLNQVVYAGKQIELGLADCLVTLCPPLTLDDMPLTDRAKNQTVIRSAGGFTYKQKRKTSDHIRASSLDRAELIELQGKGTQSGIVHHDL